MNLEEAIAYCLDRPDVTEETPFGPETLVYKVRGKMFALAIPDDVPPRMNLKAEPDQAIEWREEYEAVQPGYHMNKKHWNTVLLDGTIGSALHREMIDHSYERVVVGNLKKAEREAVLAAWER